MENMAGKTNTNVSENSINTTSNSSNVINELLEGLQKTAEDIVPRFLATMPTAYFHDTNQNTRLSHIKAIIAAEASGLSQALTLWDEERQCYTFISDRSYPGQLSEFVQRLPDKNPLSSAHVYTASDSSLVLDVFDFGDRIPFDSTQSIQCAKTTFVLEYAKQQEGTESVDRLKKHFETCSADYLLTTPPEQICKQFALVEEIRRSGNSLVRLEHHNELGLSSIAVGVDHADRRLLFERISRYLGKQGVDIQRAYLDSFEKNDSNVISLLSFLVHRSGEILDPKGDLWKQMKRDLKRLIYLDEAVLQLSQRLPNQDLLQAEVLVALGHLVHQLLVKRDPLTFSRERIAQTVLRYAQYAQEIAAFFLARFKPIGHPSLSQNATHLMEGLNTDVENPDDCEILHSFLKAVSITLRCNVYAPDRFALALRIDPSFLKSQGRGENPFGVFFISGRGFDGFHVRFRDIARGGLRIVRPLGQEQYALETERLYDEAYGLAQAQQLKNKDIPEGGSKGVILAQPDSSFDWVGRAYTDALLDLIINDSEQKRLNKDYYGRDELLYLGPDENISNSLIIWMVERARHRGHPIPDAFMSSKPGAGINHKLYGVTSEGLTVFLEAALRSCGIDPRQQSFSVKITGGPDGDVAGNEIRLLHREFGGNARIVGIADGSGCLEDPDGLNIDELLRLVEKELPVQHFDPKSLGPRGRILTIDQPGGMHARNTLHNRLITDAFIPAGGRPRTMNESNWKDFLGDGGEPSSRVIVEGANLFITPEARQRLSEQGVIIIKDSSANKCGVICSSYEIVASMLLMEREFLQIKDRFIQEVLDKLRELAKLEAESLFREQRHKPNISLPELSARISHAINRATDAITQVIETMEEKDQTLTHRLVTEHLPPILNETADNIFKRIPIAFLTRIIASELASRIVYREGLDWFEQMPEKAIGELAIRYLRAEDTMKQLVTEIKNSTLPNRERIADLLDEGGVAAALKNDG